MMLNKKGIALTIACVLACMPTGTEVFADSTEAADNSSYKIALISNQKSGDLGPVDSMFAGAKKAEKDFGVTVKTMEITDAASYEQSIRDVASAGYQLILTTFSPMTEATKAVAQDFPDTKFAAIFQNINVDDAKYDNIWDTEYRGEQATYILGAMAATLSENGKIGYISGDEASGVCSAASGYMQGALSVNPDIDVMFMPVNSYEDPTKAKEIANAMIDSGVDVIQTDAGDSQLGAIEAAKDREVFVAGDVSDNSESCPDGFFAYLGINFGENVYQAIEDFVNGEFPGGTHSIMNIQSEAYFIDFTLIENLKDKLPDKAGALDKAEQVGKDAMEKIKSGDIEVVHDIEEPSLDRVKGY